jgi:ribose transport system permease protein
VLKSGEYHRSTARLAPGVVALIAVAVVCIVLSVVAPTFLTLGNMENLALQCTIPISIATGMTLVLIGEGTKLGMDLSVGAAASMSAVLFAGFVAAGHPLWIALIVALGSGLLVGLVNGVMVVYYGVVPFIATLGTMYVLNGLELVYSKGHPIFADGEVMNVVFHGFLGFVPRPIAIIGIVIIGVYILLYHTRFGVHLYATGLHMQAARSSGVHTMSNRLIAYVIAGVLSALGGILLASRLSCAPVHAGDPFLMNAIAACFIGTSLNKDREPTLGGTIFGVLLLELLANGLTHIGVGYLYISMFKGIVVLGVVAFSAVTKR